MIHETEKEKPDLSIVIACYNEAPHLLESVKEIEAVLNQTAYSYEFIFLDDCSKDTTREVITQICRERKNSRFVFHNKNLGRGGTVREGLLMAKGSFAGFLDIDLEVQALYIPILVRLVSSGYDMACIERIEKWSWRPRSILRLLLSRVYKLLVRYVLSVRSPDSEAGYKFFYMNTMREMIRQTKDNGWFWDTEIIVDAEACDKKIRFVPAVFMRRTEKQSTVRLLPDMRAYLKAIHAYRMQRKKRISPAL